MKILGQVTVNIKDFQKINQRDMGNNYRKVLLCFRNIM